MSIKMEEGNKEQIFASHQKQQAVEMK